MSTQMSQMQLLNMKVKNPTSGCKGTIAQMCIQLLEEGKLSPKQIVEEVKKIHPNAKTSEKCVYWYASKMKINLKDRPKVQVNKDFQQAQVAFGQVA